MPPCTVLGMTYSRRLGIILLTQEYGAMAAGPDGIFAPVEYEPEEIDLNNPESWRALQAMRDEVFEGEKQ